MPNPQGARLIRPKTKPCQQLIVISPCFSARKPAAHRREANGGPGGLDRPDRQTQMRVVLMTTLWRLRVGHATPIAAFDRKASMREGGLTTPAHAAAANRRAPAATNTRES